jgi:predicted RNA-binding protein YlqC (UPF0109 family)
VVEHVTKALVDDPEAVHISETIGRGSILIELLVAPGDIGRVIGRKGRHINAMRTLARVLGAKWGKRVSLEITEYGPPQGNSPKTLF